MNTMVNHTYRKDITINMPARFIKALSYMTAQKDVRYYLNGIHIKQGMMEASDGHVAMRIESPYIALSDYDADIILSIDSIKRICRDIKVRDLGSMLTINGGMYSGQEVDFVHGRFPDVGRIIIDPWECSGEAGQFDPELLMRFKKAGKALYAKVKRVPFEVHHNGTNSSAAITYNVKRDDGCTVKGVIMPWRV